MLKLKNLVRTLVVLGAVIFMIPQNSHATILDLTAGGSGFINTAFFTTTDTGSTGSGVISSFVRLSTNQAVEQGYNTSGRPLQYDENNSGTFTHNLLLTDVPIVQLSGINYREFLLDINQNGCPKSKPDCTDPLLSLDNIQVYLSNTGSLNPSTLSSLGTKIYDLDTGGDNWLKLNYNLNSGSGSGDLFAYIPDSLFTASTYVYYYSRFGDNFGNNDGFEEWAVRKGVTPPPPVIPEPTSLLLFGTGAIGAFLRRKKV